MRGNEPFSERMIGLASGRPPRGMWTGMVHRRLLEMLVQAATPSAVEDNE
jgi:hypothetical protein